MDTARQQLVMLAHLLAVLLGFSSFTFYIAAFFYPEVHRRSDLLWSGLGMLYAAVLWFGAGQMTGTVLLGQVMSVVLLLGLGWQTLTVRREKTPIYQQTPIVLTPEVVGSWAKNKINQLRIAPDDTVRPLPPQNRSLTATAAERFRPDIDPRRRPVYDYEFVEDGELSKDSQLEVGQLEDSQLEDSQLEEDQPLAGDQPLEDSVTQPITDAVAVDFHNLATEQAASKKATPEEAAPEEEAPEEEAIVPPSAAAEILSEISPEPVNALPIEPDTEQQNPEELTPTPLAEQNDTVSTKTETDVKTKTETDVKTKTDAKAETDAQAKTDVKAEADVKTEADAKGPTETQKADVTTDEWGLEPDDDELNDDELNAAQTQSKTLNQDVRPRSPSKPVPNEPVLDEPVLNEPVPDKSDSLPAKKKPSLLATPIILLGWVKDVIGSMTKPKPSKPVIEIPRRDPQPTTQPPTKSDPYPPQPMAARANDAVIREQTDPSATTVSEEPLPEEPWTDEPLPNESWTESFAEAPYPDSSTAVDNSDNFDDDDDWEDSNWDD